MEYLKELCQSTANVSGDILMSRNFAENNSYDLDIGELTFPDGRYPCSNHSSLLGTDAVKKVMHALNMYLTPVIILVGSAGNLLAFLVFTLTHLRRQSSSIYLASLAIVDTIFLFSLTFMWLGRIKVPLVQKVGLCQCVVYLSYVTTFLSVWYVVSFTLERYIIVLYPLRKDRYCSPARAKRVVLGLALASLILYSFVTFTTGVIEIGKRRVCSPLHRFYSLLTVTELLHSSITLLMPSLLIVILNVRIVLKIVRFSKQHHEVELPSHFELTDIRCTGQHMNGVSQCSSYTRVPSDRSYVNEKTNKSLSTLPRNGLSTRMRSCTAPLRIAHTRTRAQHRTARMLIIVSSVFVLLNAPSHIFRIQTFVATSVDDRYATKVKALRWQELFQLLYHLNFSINFFLYSAYGRQFRNGLRALVSRWGHKIHRLQTHVTALSCCPTRKSSVHFYHQYPYEGGNGEPDPQECIPMGRDGSNDVQQQS